MKSVNEASLPPTKNLLVIPDFSQANPFNNACKAVEQVIECEISGPEVYKSCATQLEMLAKVVVGKLKTLALPVSKKSLKCCSNNSVAHLEEPRLIPKLSPVFQPEFFTAWRDA